ncbi:MAG: HdeA/HdeB family chaperone [Notoacmeibacter sp.]
MGISFFAVLAVPAAAEPLDVSTVTCEQVMTFNEDEATTAMIWLDGWLAGQADNTMLDPDQLGKQVEGILMVCAQNTTMSLLNAAKEYLAE